MPRSGPPADLVHHYYKVDHDAVWRVVTEHIPQMIPLLQTALADWPVPDEMGA